MPARSLPVLVLALLAAPVAGQTPALISVQGVLEDPPGTPASVPTTLTLALYDQASGGSALHSEDDLVAFDSRGVFVTTLGDSPAPVLDPAIFDRELWLGVTPFGGSELAPRTPFRAAPYALRSAVADEVSTGAALALSVAGNASAIAANTGALGDETSARIGGDGALSAQLTSEASTREASDTALAGDLADEIADRIAGDATLAADLASEAAVRAASDTALQAALASRAAAGANADITSLDAVVDITASGDVSVGGTISASGGDSAGWTRASRAVGVPRQLPRQNFLAGLDSAGQVGSYPRVTIGVEGNPLVSYYDNSAGALQLIRCTDPTCASFDTPLVLDSSGVPEKSSMALGIDGRPALAYVRSSSDSVHFVRCADEECSTAEAPRTLVTTGTIETAPQIAIGADGFPVIAYLEDQNQYMDLYFIQCTAVDCSTFDPPRRIGVNLYNSAHMAIEIGADGNPILVTEGSTSLNLLRCTSPDCSTTDPIQLLYDAGKSVEYASLILGADGLPFAMCRNRTDNELIAIHCEDAACATTSTTAVAFMDVYNNDAPSLAIGLDGNPVAGFGRLGLWVVKCNDPACAGGNETVTSLEIGGGSNHDIAIGLDGNPVLVNYDGDTKNLDLLACSNPACLTGYRSTR